MLDIDFLKVNQTELISKFKTENSVSKTDFGSLETVFRVVSQFIFQHDRINSLQSIFLHAMSSHF